MNATNAYRDESESMKRSIDEVIAENGKLMKQLRMERSADMLRSMIHLGGSWSVYGISAAFNYWWCPKTVFWLVGANLCAWAITSAVKAAK